MDSVFIVGAARTPIGDFQGQFASLAATRLGSIAIREALARSGLDAGDISEALMGCVLPAGLGQAPARQAALGAGLPTSTACTTVNKMCGSGMRSIMSAYDALKAGAEGAFVAGGMESMTNAPYLLPKARGGMRMGHGEVFDHMFHDGLADAYTRDEKGHGRLMGHFAEDTAKELRISRDDQDRFAIASLDRARTATERGAFDREIVPVAVPKRDAPVTRDEHPFTVDPARIPLLKPAFTKDADGSVTAANASSISDGAAAVVMMDAASLDAMRARRDIRPLARIVGHATFAHGPERFTTAPAGAISKLLARIGWRVTDVDLFEINEAFAVVALAAQRTLDIDADRLNVNGGACALGHPVGASGARIVVTLLNALRERGLKRGVASLCLAGGEATAIAIETL